MGMGEPLNNYAAVKGAVRQMTDSTMFGLSPRSVTVSTVGIVPRMRTFVVDLPGVSLALSLHAPTQAKREAIMPAARAYPLERVLAALEAHMEAARPPTPTSKTAMVEYIMLRDVNDTPDDALALAHLLQPHAHKLMVNLIPYNPTDATPEYRRATEAATAAFMRVLREAGVLTCVRRTMGGDIAGACGQLVRQQEEFYAAERTANRAGEGATTATHDALPCDIEDLSLGLSGSLRKGASVARALAPSTSAAATSAPAPRARRRAHVTTSHVASGHSRSHPPRRAPSAVLHAAIIAVIAAALAVSCTCCAAMYMRDRSAVREVSFAALDRLWMRRREAPSTPRRRWPWQEWRIPLGSRARLSRAAGKPPR